VEIIREDHTEPSWTQVPSDPVKGSMVASLMDGEQIRWNFNTWMEHI
jgi:hypothetical protein